MAIKKGQMRKRKFIQIAASLGVAIPACLFSLSQDCNATASKAVTPSAQSLSIKNATNPIKERILNAFNAEEQTPASLIAHTNVHANYTIPHTNMHENYWISGEHTDCHSNTRAFHTNEHSNSKV